MPKHHGIKGFANSEEKDALPLEDPRHLVEVLNDVFRNLDLNHDKVLSQDELDQEVMNASIGEADAEAVSILKACFADVKELHKEGWFARKNGITLADLLVFEQIILQEESDKAAASHKHLRDLVNVILQNVRSTWNSPRSLYAYPSNPLESIRIEAIRQGIVGDCYFLAALASLTVACPEIIPRMIESLEDGRYKVRFPGDRDIELIVEQPTIVELALYAKCSQFGTWPAVLEKAYGSYLIETQTSNTTIIPADATNAAQHTFEAFDLLSGQTGHWEFLPLTDDDKLKGILGSAFHERRAVAAGTCASKTGVTADGFASSHAFSVIGWNAPHEIITLRNPWGRLMEQAAASHHTIDGMVTISLTEFRRNFLAIYFEDWTPDARFDG